MDPFIGGALISAGSSLLGGLFGSNSAKKAQKAQLAAMREEREYNTPINVRARAEQAGVNPLLFMGPGVGQASGAANLNFSGGNYLGSALADAGMILADGMSRSHDAKKKSALEVENEALKKRVTDLTLRPKVGGIYANNVQTPTMRQALGVGNGGVVARSSSLGQGADNTVSDSDARLGTQPNPLAPGREKETDPVKNVSGMFEIQNWLTANKPVSLYGQDADDVSDLLLQLPIVAPQVSYNWGEWAADKQVIRDGVASIRDGRPVMRANDGKYYARQPDPDIDGGIYLRSPDYPPPSRPNRGRTYKPPTKRMPLARVWDY